MIFIQKDPNFFESSIIFTGNQKIRSYNLNYRGIDTPTDVLSFPGDELDPETGKIYLGDIMVSVPTAEAQAKSAGHSLETEISILIVHGLLHLLGYDHIDEFQKKEMWKIQDAILRDIGINTIIP
jgi:probable rRNA maturation factor